MVPAPSEPIECGTIVWGSRPWPNHYAGGEPLPALERVTLVLDRFFIQVCTGQGMLALFLALEIMHLHLHVLLQRAVRANPALKLWHE